MKSSVSTLHVWFESNQRQFPWRLEKTPYRVWISEIMLQQTRAVVVIAYFERWMKLFPSVHSLAEAPFSQVIKAWEGLGYYSRVRNIYAVAQLLVKEYGGNLPSSKEELLKLPGFGPYTTAAVLSFAFHQKAAAIDGNVIRVISRFAWIEGIVTKASVKKQIIDFAENFLCQKSPWITAEALIELGATICSPTPRCDICPLKESCKAALQNNVVALPMKACQPKIEKISRGVAIVEANGKVLLRKNHEGQMMEDLHEFPYFDGAISHKSVQQKISQLLHVEVKFLRRSRPVQHCFTRFKVTLFPFYFVVPKCLEVEGFAWVPRHQLVELSFSSGHRKIVRAETKLMQASNAVFSTENEF